MSDAPAAHSFCHFEERLLLIWFAFPEGELCITSSALRKPRDVIPSKVREANFVEGSRTGPRTRTRYRFLVREALLGYAKVSFREEG
jgi:hypothetical protein